VEKARSLLDVVRGIVGKDSLMVFGPTGSGKTTFCLALAHEAAKREEKVVYLDTEANLAKPIEGVSYRFTPSLRELENHVYNLPSDARLVIIDSLGTPIIAAYADAGMHEKGSMLLKAASISSALKLWCLRSGGLAVVTNQPTSSFGKSNVKPEDLPPRLGSSHYYYKEIWRTDVVEVTPTRTVCSVKAWRSRNHPRGKLLFQISISSNGVEVKSTL